MFRTIAKRGIEEFWRPVPVEGPIKFGRAWKRFELEKKSFDDLHKLWYVCCKEQNLLATEREHCKTHRLEFQNRRAFQELKKTMLRIKLVVRFRQLKGEKLPMTRSPVKDNPDTLVRKYNQVMGTRLTSNRYMLEKMKAKTSPIHFLVK